MSRTEDNSPYVIKLAYTNCFLLPCSGGYMMIDTSYARCYARFRKRLATMGVDIRQIKYLLLTHHHDDHAGFASMLVRDSGCRVIAHRNAERPLAKGESEDTAEPANWRLKFVFAVYGLAHRSYRYPPLVLTKDDILLDGDDLSLLNRIDVDGVIVHTPGHTRTCDCISVVLGDGKAFVGDAAMNFLRWTGIGHRPAAIGNVDALHTSWRKLRDRGAAVIYPAHGRRFPAAELIAACSIPRD